jgi:hypothetical protein
MSEEDQMMQAIALSLGENFPMVVDQVILVVVMMHGMFGTLVVLVIIVVLYNDGVMVQ